MNSISANDLKTKGVSAIERALEDQPEVSLTVRGQAKFVVMSRDSMHTCASANLKLHWLNRRRIWTPAAS